MLPRRDVGKIQNEIANVKRFQKPHWRSKWLMFAILMKPHRVEPLAARAYNALLDFLRVFQGEPELCALLTQHALLDLPKTALISSVKAAFEYFGIVFTSDLKLFWGDKFLCHINQVTLSDLKAVLPFLAGQRCYEEVSKKKREDFFQPTGILDHQFSTLFLRCNSPSDATIPDNAFFESQIIGCTLTRDRLIHANLVDSSQCRFFQ